MELCDLPGCADAEVCQNPTPKRTPVANLSDRQFDCPPEVECGPGPVCTSELCELPGCADAQVCQGSTPKRTPVDSLVDRQFDCPPGLECGPGPVCTLELCGLPGCADAAVCQNTQDRKRNITPPVCDICIVGSDGHPVCGCATPGNGTVKRDEVEACPLFCITTEDGETLCGCEAVAYEKANQGTD